MSLVAVIILTLGYLAHLPLGQPLRQALQNTVIGEPSGTRLSTPSPHQRIAEPIKSGAEELRLGARAAYAVDLDTATPLYQQNSAQPLPIASIAKIVTAMVIIKSHDLEEVVTVPTLPAYRPEDAKLGLTAGQRFKVKDLLAATLIPSASDAADALASADAGSNAAFAAKMNRLSERWGIKGTRFTNPSGLGAEENLASAEALARLAKIALANQTFAQLAAAPTATITDQAGQTYPLTSTNRLLGDPRITGLKTGYTPAAGQSFLALSTVNGHRVLTVVLNSPDRFAETAALINWIERNYHWR
ncbi:serine hydrolase [Candidatus Parcubacteria bacterium]|nr:serine hydrolase [Candidatus Parcubacteria bacterium]